MNNNNILDWYDTLQENLVNQDDIQRPINIIPCGPKRFYKRLKTGNWVKFECSHIFYNGIKQKLEDGTIREIWRYSEPINHIPLMNIKYECKRRVDKDPIIEKSVNKYIDYIRLVQLHQAKKDNIWKEYCKQMKENQ